MRTLAVPVELLEQAADALEDSRYSGYDWIANALRALLAALGVEPSHVALLESHDERRWKAVIVPPGQSLEFDDDGATRKWLWPHLGNDFHLDSFVPIETPAPEER